MFCRKCGNVLKDGTEFCEYCGEPVSVSASLDHENDKNNETDKLFGIQGQQQSDSANNEKVGFNSNLNDTTQSEVHKKGLRIGYFILGLFFPIIGLIVGLIFIEKDRADDKMKGKSAIYGAASAMILGIIFSVISLLINMNQASYSGSIYSIITMSPLLFKS